MSADDDAKSETTPKNPDAMAIAQLIREARSEERARCELLVLGLRNEANLQPWGAWAWTKLDRLARQIRNGQ
jgi:hypothetical protein